MYSCPGYAKDVGIASQVSHVISEFEAHLGDGDSDPSCIVWVVDFGGLKPLKKWLEDTFDHKVVLDRTDPYLYKFAELENAGLAELTLLDGVGVEKFAEHAFNFADELVKEMTNDRCHVVSCECAEHGANSAIYEG